MPYLTVRCPRRVLANCARLPQARLRMSRETYGDIKTCLRLFQEKF